MKNLSKEKFAEIKLSIDLVIPYEVVCSNNKEKIAEYLSEKLHNDPEFFGDFGPENVQIISYDIGKV